MSDEDMKVEAILGRYRPAGPPVELRDRVLRSAEPRRSRLVLAGWLSMAAMVGLSIGLYLATEHVTRQTATALATGRAGWTAEADEAVELLNGQGAGRRYIAIALAADEPRMAQLRRQGAAISRLGVIQ